MGFPQTKIFLHHLLQFKVSDNFQFQNTQMIPIHNDRGLKNATNLHKANKPLSSSYAQSIFWAYPEGAVNDRWVTTVSR